MRILESKLKDCYIIKSDIYEDDRGSFNKTYYQEKFREKDINIDIKEQFYTVSSKNVLRGMHFQIPPFDHSKLVCCLSGSIIDVVLDLRKSSSSYKKFDVFELKANDGNNIFIPPGMAHGFLSLENNSGVLYNTSSAHNSEADKGVHWSSFGFDWRCQNPIISERDQKHLPLSKLNDFFK
jgi:dTDP-4-dehydrorhamnose 3,5-epimerase